MGLRYVRAAQEIARDRLSLSARLVLVAMAAQVLDKPKPKQPAGVYWGGLVMLTEACGLTSTDYHMRSIRRHLATLREAGLIALDRPGVGGITAAYRLTFEPAVRLVHMPVDVVDNAPSREPDPG